jgi:hypothetical protein
MHKGRKEFRFPRLCEEKDKIVEKAGRTMGCVHFCFFMFLTRTQWECTQGGLKC